MTTDVNFKRIFPTLIIIFGDTEYPSTVDDFRGFDAPLTRVFQCFGAIEMSPFVVLYCPCCLRSQGPCDSGSSEAERRGRVA